MTSTASLVAKHILRYVTSAPRSESQAPLFVALQGPQGSGKTHLTRTLVSMLSSPPHSLRVVVFSVDDLYLTRDGLIHLACSWPSNKLWGGRGLPGTHDVALGANLLTQLRAINVDSNSKVILPHFDKSKFAGQGDRDAKGTTVQAPVDIILFEGWCVGFYPLAPDELDAKWESVCAEVQRAPESIVARAMNGVWKKSIVAINEALRDYVKEWYPFFEVFVQICPPAHTQYEYIYTWRLEQEHNMKAANGDSGMTDREVKRFVDRYIPGYVFFGEGVRRGGQVEGRPPWEGKGLGITINKEREVVATEHF